MKQQLFKRLQEAMNIRGFRQVDLVEKTGLSKSKINMYVNGDHSPKHEAVYLLAKALGVQEAWLMGYDVPMEADTAEVDFSEEDTNMIRKYRALDDHGRTVVNYILDEEYTRSSSNVVQMPPAVKEDLIYDVGKIAAAGRGVYIDGIPGEIIKVKNKPDDATFVIGVTGDSMEPTYYDGDEVYVKKQRDLEFNEIGLWQVGSEFFIKEYGPDGLRSHNPKYPVMKGTPDMVLIGKVLGLVKR